MAQETPQEVLLQLENQKDVFCSPIKRSERIKYTCFTVSKNYVIFGATSGGLYTFKRNPYSFWQLIPSKENSVTFVSISSAENFIAFATNKSIICVLELNEYSNGKMVMRADDLSDSEITALCWSDDFSKPTLYIGDSNGRVSLLKLSFLSKNILHLPTTVFMTLDSRVIQLCWQNEYLLASTLTRCYLCDTIKEQFRQIGQQLRDGFYGATFLKCGTNVRVFCARPGSRLWEVDLDSVVHSTHQFKRQLAVPPSTFISIFEEPKVVEAKPSEIEWSQQSFNFIKLYDLLGRYIVTYRKDALYILNIDTVGVLFWNNSFGEIVDVQCIMNTIFVWNTNGDLHELVLLPIEKCLLTLYFKKCSRLCVEVICRYFDTLTSNRALSELSPLCDLDNSELSSEEADLLAKFKEKVNRSTFKDVELGSGIHIVNNRHFSSLLLDDSKLIASRKHRSLLRSDSEEGRKRSHSLPSNLKKDKSENTNSTDGWKEDNEQSNFSMHNGTDNLYLEMGLYNSPLMTLASYEILEDGLLELGASVSEKFNESSKNLKEKWQLLENKLTFLRNKKPNEKLVTVPRDNHFDAYGDMEIEAEEIAEPVVNSKKKKSGVDVDYSKMIELCDRDDVDVFELMNVVVREYQRLAEQYGIAKYEQFPFNMSEKSVVKVKKLFKSFFAKDTLLKWFVHEAFPINEDANVSELYPPLLLEIYSRDELKQDFLLCKVLVIFSELISASTILETVKSFEFPCYYMSFCYIMKYFQNGEVLERNNCTKGDCTHWPLPVYLNTMLLMVSLDQIDVFCEMGLKKNIDVSDVVYMMLHLEHSEKTISENKEKYKTIWLMYLQKHCARNPSSLNNPYTTSLAVKIFTMVNEKSESCCVTCWFLLPEPQSAKIKFLGLGHSLLAHFWHIFQSACVGDCSYSHEALMLIRRSVSDTSEYENYAHCCYKNLESCKHGICQKFQKQLSSKPTAFLLLSFNIICSFCYRIPELWKYLSTLQRDSMYKILHPEHFIQLGNIGEVESVLQELTNDDARRLLQWKTTLVDGFCLNCESKIPVNREDTSWNELALLVLRRLGAQHSLHILDEFSEHIKLEKSFYRSVILTSIPRLKPDWMETVISAVSSHYNVAPASASTAEQISHRLKLDRPDKEFEARTSDSHHWGIAVNLEDGNQTICYCCSLPLFSKSLIKEDNGGIMVFSCGHTYHTVCLKNKNCTATCLVCDRFLR